MFWLTKHLLTLLINMLNNLSRVLTGLRARVVDLPSNELFNVTNDESADQPIGQPQPPDHWLKVVSEGAPHLLNPKQLKRARRLPTITIPWRNDGMAEELNTIDELTPLPSKHHSKHSIQHAIPLVNKQNAGINSKKNLPHKPDTQQEINEPTSQNLQNRHNWIEIQEQYPLHQVNGIQEPTPAQPTKSTHRIIPNISTGDKATNRVMNSRNSELNSSDLSNPIMAESNKNQETDFLHPDRDQRQSANIKPKVTEILSSKTEPTHQNRNMSVTHVQQAFEATPLAEFHHNIDDYDPPFSDLPSSLPSALANPSSDGSHEQSSKRWVDLLPEDDDLPSPDLTTRRKRLNNEQRGDLWNVSHS